MKLFSMDSPFYKFMQRLFDVLKLNGMWLLCSLPIVTIGSSTIAAFSVTLRMTEDTEGYVARDFWKAFKSSLKQGIPMTFITLICFFAVYSDFLLFGAVTENAFVFLIFGVLAAYVFIFSLIYVYPLLARYDNTVINSLKNSFRLGMKYFPRTLLLVLLLAFELAIIFWNTTTMFVGLLIGPICIIYTISGTAMYIFRDMEKIPGSTREKNGE